MRGPSSTRHDLADARRYVAGWICLVGFILPGCASMALPQAPVEDVTPQRRARNEAAIREFELKRDQAQYGAAAFSWETGDLDGCYESLTQLIRRTPHHRKGRLLLADVFLFREQPQLALEQLQAAAAHHPDDAEVEHSLGLAFDALGDTTTALAHYERAHALAPGDERFATSLNLARQFAAGGVPPVAPASFTPPTNAAGVADGNDASANAGYPAPPAAGHSSRRHAARGSTSSRSEQEAADERLDHAKAALMDEDAAGALACLREACASAPHDPQLLIAAATLALRHGQPGIASSLLEEASPSFSHHARVQLTRGLALYRRGDYQGARQVLERAVSLDNTNALSYFLLGSSLAKLGQEDAAEWHYQRAQELDPQYTTRR